MCNGDGCNLSPAKTGWKTLSSSSGWCYCRLHWLSPLMVILWQRRSSASQFPSSWIYIIIAFALTLFSDKIRTDDWDNGTRSMNSHELHSFGWCAFKSHSRFDLLPPPQSGESPGINAPFDHNFQNVKLLSHGAHQAGIKRRIHTVVNNTISISVLALTPPRAKGRLDLLNHRFRSSRRSVLHDRIGFGWLCSCTTDRFRQISHCFLQSKHNPCAESNSRSQKWALKITLHIVGRFGSHVHEQCQPMTAE